MFKNYPTLKILAPLFFFLVGFTAFSQTAGDFRSKAAGPSSWQIYSSWQTYNGTTWVDANSYPGQNAGTGAVLIQFGHSITLSSTITTQNFGNFTIAGRLVLNGDNSAGGMNFSLNTPKIYVTPSPNGGFIEFNNKLNLRLPATAFFIVSIGGLDVSSGCSANQIIYIGDTAYAKCNGGGSQLPEFTDVMAGGGTLSANPTSNSPVCSGNSINLIGGYNGAVGDGVDYKWEITYPDNTTSSSTIKDISIPSEQIGSYSAKLTCTTYFGSDSVTNYKSISVTVNTNTWNGSSNEDWNNPTNWSCGGVPSISSDVLIPAIPTGGKFPILSAFTVLPYPEGYVKNIVLESGTTLIIENNALNVAGNMTLNGKIDLNNEAQLVQGTRSVLDGTGTIEIDQQGTGDSYNYNYWSSPVRPNLAAKTYSIGAVLKDGTDPTAIKNITFGTGHTWAELVIGTSPIRLSTYWMYKLENSKGYAAWTRISDNISIKAGEGYTMKGSNTTAPMQNYTFVGKPNNGDISLPIAIANDYLVGNPYPSALDADQFITDNLAHTGPLYFWEHYGGGTHNLAGYQGGYATYTKAGGVSASMGPAVAGISTSGTSSKGKPGRYVPVGQAFFVVGGAANGYINFKNSQRIFVKESQRDTYNDPFSVFMKTSNTKVKDVDTDTDLSDLRPKFRIGFDAPKISHRQLLLTIDEKATPEFDRGYEAEIYETFADDFYWMMDGKKYIIQATNNVGLKSEVPLGIQLSKTGMITVKIDALENVDDDTTIYLKDKVTGKSFNMRDKSVALNLTAGKYTDRFVLIFKTQKLLAEDVKAELLIPAAAQPFIEGIHVFMNNAIGELQIKNNSTEEILSITLINAVGQTVKYWNSNFNIRTISLPISTATGVYVVQINTKTGKTVKKISVE